MVIVGQFTQVFYGLEKYNNSVITDGSEEHSTLSTVVEFCRFT